MAKLKGKVAIVTGASRGIGKAACFGLAREGANIVVAARTETATKLPGTIHQTAEEIRALGMKALAVRTDVSDEASVEQMVGKTLDEFGRIDILVNNAAVAWYPPLWETPTKRWDLVIGVNLRGTFLCTKAVLPALMKQKSGSIINITSIYAEMGTPRAAPYCAAKAGLASLTRSLAAEWAPYGIHVNAIGPGFIRTEMTEPYFSDPLWAGALPNYVPLKRVGEPREVALLAIYLASKASDFMTGQSLYLDGGILAPGRNAMEW